ncbi:MAG: hypothetical protein S4CHLAM81_10620 [Chlamydiales bacterium]|nr:hypothetical protein [Chlamydiales bacterium]MCH9635840.1 hypothetical protein [Chlamydiales bacterium]MCH9704138.1 hypothetical protein [Chlamydiota bacterium]
MAYPVINDYSSLYNYVDQLITEQNNSFGDGVRKRVSNFVVTKLILGAPQTRQALIDSIFQNQEQIPENDGRTIQVVTGHETSVQRRGEMIHFFICNMAAGLSQFRQQLQPELDAINNSA